MKQAWAFGELGKYEDSNKICEVLVQALRATIGNQQYTEILLESLLIYGLNCANVGNFLYAELYLSDIDNLGLMMGDDQN